MNMKVRALCIAVVLLAAMWTAGCGHYVCGHTFGSATCTASGSGISGGGTGQTSADAFVFFSSGTTVSEDTLSVSTSSLAATVNYTGPTTPNGNWATTVAQGKYLYTAYGIGEIYGWTIGSDGSLTAVTGSPFSAPYMVGSTYGGPATQVMITNPAGTLLFVQNELNDAVYVYQIGSGGTLTAATGTPLLLPFLPGNLATDGLGKYLYVSNVVSGSATSEIAAYSINSTTGALTSVFGSPFVSTGSSLEYSMFQLQGESSGKYMIGTTAGLDFGGDLHLYVFNIAQSGTNAGAITPVSGSPFATVYPPYRIAVQPSAGGNLVYSFSISSTGTDSPIEGFTLNTSTGALSEISGSPFSSASGTGDSGQFDQSGAYLFALDSSNSTMSVFSVGSSGALTTPVGTNAFPSLGAWAVADVP
jgi:6-phosphogluconolactonase